MAMQLWDIVMSFLILIVILGLAPVMYVFIGEIAAEVGILTRIILSMIVPLLFIMLILSGGIAARGGSP